MQDASCPTKPFMIIKILYQNDQKDFVPSWELDSLIQAKKIKAFRRTTGWATIGKDMIRNRAETHNGLERREQYSKSTQDELASKLKELEKELAGHYQTVAELQKIKSDLEARLHKKTSELLRKNEELRHGIEDNDAMEVALKNAYREFYQIFNNAFDGMYVIDREFNILRMNKAFSDLAGIEDNDVLGQKCYEVFGNPLCHTSNCPLNQKLDRKIRREFETERKRQNGDKIPCLTSVTPFLDATGEIIGIIETSKDITRWKEEENTLRTHMENLEQSNRNLQDFAYVASHDLREPLLLIRAFGARLLSKWGDSLPEQAREYLERIDKAVMRMQGLIDGLLMYCRISTSSHPFTLEPVDLAKVVQEVLSNLDLRLKQTNGRIELGELPVLEADHLQMYQLFQNLIGNALKYRQHKKNPVIKISSKKTNNADKQAYTIFVQDNGIGFDEKSLDLIFSMFKRLHGRNQYEGTGIGLAICKRIAERHHGRITAKSSPGHGATFIVNLPATQSE